MNFNLTEDTGMVKDNANKFLKDKCTSSAVKEMIDSEECYSKTLWKEIADLGWIGYVYDEKYGGSGGSFFDLFIIFEQIGKYLLPSPFLESGVLSGFIINEAGSDEQKDLYLPSLVMGKKILTTALLDEAGNYDFDNPALRVDKTGSGKYVMHGKRTLVPYANVADGIIVCANIEGQGATLFIIEKPFTGIKLEQFYTLTGEKRWLVDFQKVELTEKNILGEMKKGSIYINNIIPRLVVLKCGEMLGGLERVCNMTVQYMKEREQFGAPLGRLQAVQHYCADMATYYEGAKLIAYQAASLADKGRPYIKEMHMAKAWLSDTYKKATWIAHQLHGAIGFAEEHDLHLYYKHAKVSEFEFGDSAEHRDKLASEMSL